MQDEMEQEFWRGYYACMRKEPINAPDERRKESIRSVLFIAQNRIPHYIPNGQRSRNPSYALVI